MLKNDFFYIQSLSDDQGIISAVIEINPFHKIFEGHFPGRPVVPGVCMMQMIKEITETVMGKDFFLHKAGIVKFLSVIVPQKDKTVQAQIKYSEIENNTLNFDATLFKEDTIYLKFKGEFVAEYGIAS
ncbi:MAG: 3-hydroxyacyl-ACP dehydratase [Chitinophagaceae bacterium]|nr:3-hydroxyacyl-ACP dehydratase [Chitinophagaceae bacterium]